MSSLKITLSFMYAAQIYRAVLPFVFLPLYINFFGAEPYGIVAFYLVLVGLLGLLDVGFSATFIKLLSGSKNSSEAFKISIGLYRKFLFYIFVIAIFVAGVFFLFSYEISVAWLNTSLDIAETSKAIQFMGVVLALTYMKQFVACYFTALEQHRLIAIFNILFPSLTYGGSYAFLVYTAGDFVDYFLILLIVNLVELLILLILFFYSQKVMQKRITNLVVGSMTEKTPDVRKLLKFSAYLASLSLLWVLVSQIDKFLLSKNMPIAEFPNYQIAAQLATAIGVLVTPLMQFMMPRLNALYQSGEWSSYTDLFLKALLIFCLVSVHAMSGLWFFSADLIEPWLGQAELAKHVGENLKWLFISAVFGALMQFIFLLLYSHGKLKEHLKVYGIYTAIVVILTVYLVEIFALKEIAIWVALHSALFFFSWGAFIMHRYFSGLKFILATLFVFISLSVAFDYLYLITAGKANLVSYLPFKLLTLCLFYGIWHKIGPKFVRCVMLRVRGG